MTEPRFVPNASCDLSGPPERAVLERACAKVVLLGAEAGFSIDQMIEWLDSGMTVPELISLLTARARVNA